MLLTIVAFDGCGEVNASVLGLSTRVLLIRISNSVGGYGFAFSRRRSRPSDAADRPRMRRGRRECRVLAATHGPRAVKKHGEGTTGSAKSSGIPCAMVLTLMARSPWEPGFLAPIAREIITSRAWPQRREARTTRFCVRISAVRPHEDRARRQRVHRIPRSTYRDDRPKRPS